MFFSPYHNNLPIHMYDHFDYLMYLVKGRVHESPRIQLKRDREQDLRIIGLCTSDFLFQQP